jgi:hypothetical protein
MQKTSLNTATPSDQPSIQNKEKKVGISENRLSSDSLERFPPKEKSDIENPTKIT